MTDYWTPSDAELRIAKEKALRDAGGKEDLAVNYLYRAIFGRDGGMYAKPHPPNEWYYDEHNVLQRLKRRISRREWMEAYFTIKPKGSAPLQRMVLNPAQRKLEATVIRLERLGVPVRIVICKARQTGFSTYVEALMFWFLLTGRAQKGLLIADVDERAAMLLNMAHTAMANMPRGGGTEIWNLKMTSRASYSLAWAEPIVASINIASAQKDSAGRGGTRDVLHISETAFWPEAERKAPGVLESLPDIPGTYGFNESTANGDSGWFRNEFWESWKYSKLPLHIAVRKRTWIAMFFGWWEHPGYRVAKDAAYGLDVTPDEITEIANTLDEEEEWLLTQTYIRRWAPTDEWEKVTDGKGGYKFRRKYVGEASVSYEQLAWRRRKIEDARSRGGKGIFNQEMPSRPSVAFLASGRRVFDADMLEEYMKRVKKPIWTGSIHETADSIRTRTEDMPGSRLRELRELEERGASS